MADAAGPSFWSSAWDGLPPLRAYEGPVHEQHPVLAPFLSRTGGGTAIEIGCVPGNFLVWLHKEFHYTVSGVDYTDRLDYVRANLELNRVPCDGLYKADFFSFTPPTRYDLVFSGGFVEHFDEHEEVLRRHAELARPGGLVVIWVPNLTHLHKLLCSLFQPQLLAVHRFQLMDRGTLRSALQAAGLEVLHCEYSRTFRPTYPLPYGVDLISRACQRTLRFLRLDDIGNRFASPYLISVSRKPVSAP